MCVAEEREREASSLFPHAKREGMGVTVPSFLSFLPAFSFNQSFIHSCIRQSTFCVDRSSDASIGCFLPPHIFSYPSTVLLRHLPFSP
mmetsp:Transcript_2115/g.4460  ORF Transcript_2115/g.4460 Transcript_2115/m.4460 type:complete len:88 (+) Transcript_2115:1739-2002(+)